MQLNGIELVDRHNRPNVSQRVALRTLFINDGVYADPVDISSVTIFKASSNLSPNSILDNNQVIDMDGVSGSILMTYCNSSTTTTDIGFDPVNYQGKINIGTEINDTKNASGIYKVGTGDYVVVLDNTIDLSGVVASGTESEAPLTNAASSTDNYIDVWTVRFSAGSTYNTYINTFKLHNDTIFSLTEPLLLTTRNSLSPKHIKLGSKIDLKMPTEISVENKSLDESVINIFKESVVTSATMEIKKINEDPNLDARVSVSSFSDTLNLVNVTSDNTLILSWDTNGLKQNTPEGLGSQTGVYSIQAKYWVLNQVIYTPLFNVIVN